LTGTIGTAVGADDRGVAQLCSSEVVDLFMCAVLADANFLVGLCSKASEQTRKVFGPPDIAFMTQIGLLAISAGDDFNWRKTI
jgi:hypothetical protein